MNYLAHAYLSFADPDILLGNMIGDFVRGRILSRYPLNVARGIRLHRAIDHFTDQHPATLRARAAFRSDYGRYSGVFADVAYDHFLARDSSIFPENSLLAFSQRVYTQLNENEELFPATFRQMLSYMSAQNWLWGYRTQEGMAMAFGGITRRAKFLSDAAPAVRALDRYYDMLKNCYTVFFPDVIDFSRHFLNLHPTNDPESLPPGQEPQT